MKAISEGDGELLQKDIYSRLPNIPRGTIQSVIRQLEHEGRSLRDKKGSTYKLSIVQSK